MGGDRRLLGRWGEMLAADFLRRKGYTILAAGWRCRQGEIDLIAFHRHYLAFVEVKLRKDDRLMAAREAVDRHKQDRLRTSAQLYLAANQDKTELQPRFDVIEVYAPQGTATVSPRIVHLEDAFQ